LFSGSLQEETATFYTRADRDQYLNRLSEIKKNFNSFNSIQYIQYLAAISNEFVFQKQFICENKITAFKNQKYQSKSNVIKYIKYIKASNLQVRGWGGGGPGAHRNT
jgi:hypothetical protein